MDPLRSAQLLFLVLFVLPSATATEPVTGHIEHHGATTLTGLVDLEAESSVFWKDPASTHPWSAHLDMTDAVAHLYNIPTYRLWLGGPSSRGIGNATTPESGEQQIWQHTATHLEAGGPDGTLRILPLGTGTHPFRLATDHVELDTPAAIPKQRDDTALKFTDAIGGHPVRPTGTHATITTPTWPVQELAGRFVAFVVADTVLLDGKSVHTGTYLNTQKSHIDPITGTGRYVYDNLVLVLEFNAARVEVQDGPGWSLASLAASGTVSGEATWRNVVTAVEAGGQELPRDQHILTMQGDLAFHATIQGSDTLWDVDGDVTSILVDTVPILTAALASAASLGLLALLLLFLTETGRGLLTALIGRSTPRLVKARALGSPARRRLLQIIHEQQPVRQMDLVAHSGYAKTTVAYHLRILCAHDILQTAWSGDRRGTAYMLNSGSLMFQSPGLVEPTGPQGTDATLRPGQVLAVAHGHPLRRDLFEAIRTHGPADFETLQRLLADRHATIPQSTASRHLIRLEQVRAVCSEWKDGRKQYRANIDPGEARREQYLLYLRHHGLTDLVSTLAREGPCTPEELSALVGDGPRIVYSSLRDLVGLGLVDRRPQNRYAVSPILPQAPEGLAPHA